MSDTYTKHANICAKFYELAQDSSAVADFILSKVKAVSGQKVLFIGGMFNVAKELEKRILQLSVVDYTDEMVAIGKRNLPNARVIKADIRALPFESEFDFVFVIGRVFTHMIFDSDLSKAIQSCKRCLKSGGKLFVDNYESNKIQKTNYFNGKVKCSAGDTLIIRDSNTVLLSSNPFVVQWNAEYSGRYDKADFLFSDSMQHRAFSRVEFLEFMQTAGFLVLEQGDNFDETSFYTLAENRLL